MASLQINKLAGVVSDLGIADGPPKASVSIAAGTSGNAYGTVNVPEICELSAIGADVTLTWPGPVVEVLSSGQTVIRRMRGEAVTVA